MIQAAGTLLQRRGYFGTGLNDVVAESKAPKGSLYFHFPGGKEELAARALEQQGARTLERFREIIQRSRDAGDAVGRIADDLARQLRGSEYMLGSPIATVALETAATSDVLQAVCSSVFLGLERLLARCFARTGLPTQRADSLAALALSALEGALILSRAHRDVALLRRVGGRAGAPDYPNRIFGSELSSLSARSGASLAGGRGPAALHDSGGDAAGAWSRM